MSSQVISSTELKANQSYPVQNVSKLSRDTKRFIGLPALFKSVTGSTASVRITNNMHSVPVRCLIKVPGFVAKAVAAKNADGFIVIAQNKLSIPVGRVYLGHTKVNDTHATFLLDGKELHLPLEILASLVKVKSRDEPVSKKAMKKVAKGYSEKDLDTLDVPEAREDIAEVPAFLQKLCPNLTVEELRIQVSNTEGTYADYDGNPHPTMQEADRANAILRYRSLAKLASNIVHKHSLKAFETIIEEAEEKAGL